jgi:hypothetical protein
VGEVSSSFPGSIGLQALSPGFDLRANGERRGSVRGGTKAQYVEPSLQSLQLLSMESVLRLLPLPWRQGDLCPS